MKNNKLLSVLLALLVCLSMVVSASATSESDLSFTLESDSRVEALEAAVVKAGETFTVNVNIEKNPGVLAAIAYVEFDSAKLELVSVKAVSENVKVNTLNGRVHVVVGNTDAIFNPAKYQAVTATGAVAELTFKVLVETDEQISIDLKASQSNVFDANGKFDAITVSGDVMTVNVVGPEHACDASKTTDAKNKVDPTCTEEGKTSDLICSHCGKVVTEGEKIAATGHTMGDYIVTTPSTCENFGIQTRTCSVCGATETDNTVPKAEHSFGDWKVTTEPTTEAEGVETRTCSGCGLEETRSVEKLPPVVQPEPKNNTLLIVIIVVVVLAGAGVAAFFILKNKKK